jgi:hypothetical protein
MQPARHSRLHSQRGFLVRMLNLNRYSCLLVVILWFLSVGSGEHVLLPYPSTGSSATYVEDKCSIELWTLMHLASCWNRFHCHIPR